MITELKIIDFDSAQGRTKQIYEDIESAMAITWVPDVFQALGNYPHYLDLSWQNLKPILGRAGMEWPADTLRSLADSTVALFAVPDHDKSLAKLGFGERQVMRIKETLEPFYYNNPRVLIMVAALRESLAGKPLGSSPTGEAATLVETSAYQTPVKFVRPEEAGKEVGDIYREIFRTFSPPIISGSFQSLAQWPDYLEIAVQDFKHAAKTGSYEQHTAEFRKMALSALSGLPYPVRIDRGFLLYNGVSESQINEIGEILDVFFDFLPDLVFSTSFLYMALRGGNL